MTTTTKNPDLPHAYKPRKVTADRLGYSHLAFSFRKKQGAFGPGTKPCDVCGCSVTHPLHNVSATYVRKFPSRWSEDDVWMASMTPLAL